MQGQQYCYSRRHCITVLRSILFLIELLRIISGKQEVLRLTISLFIYIIY